MASFRWFLWGLFLGGVALGIGALIDPANTADLAARTYLVSRTIAHALAVLVVWAAAEVGAYLRRHLRWERN